MVNNNYKTKYDVFHSYLVRNATYAGEEEFPVIKSFNEILNRIIPFSEAMNSKNNDFDCWDQSKRPNQLTYVQYVNFIFILPYVD